MSSKLKMSNGDWVCTDKRCGNVNFARRTSCNRCGKEKGNIDKIKLTGAEIGKQAAAKSRGLFSADDWMCSKCGNVNWARRNDCNMCGHPKFAKAEVRTGYGGGFNEREGVEYIQREDSDDEFDEFGRKKKGKQGASQAVDEQKPKTEEPNNKGEEDDYYNDGDDDDDDDDEEGDLSKYNLDDEDDDDEDGDLSKYQLDDDSDNENKDKGR
ncbi:zinc finger Ran-binding domain-containing protein 2-like isoform X4 [Pocillopora damicornis]|nr:zinc finger Ran-binding domain-containing protein 2-like isoform X4 [Pocillopora damicornis]